MGRERKTLEPREAIENTIGMAENARVSEIHRDRRLAVLYIYIIVYIYIYIYMDIHIETEKILKTETETEKRTW